MIRFADDYFSDIRLKMLKNQERLSLNAESEAVQFSATKDLLDRADRLCDEDENSGDIPLNIKGFS